VAQSNIQQPLKRAPFMIRFPGPIVRRLLRFGMPMGPNGLLTVCGRISGQPRTQPLAVVELDGRRYVVGLVGDVNWCRNLQAHPDAELELHGRSEPVRAVELSQEQAAAFFGDVLVRYRRQLPLFWRVGVGVLIRAAAPEILSDPAQAATKRPVFELLPLDAQESSLERY
jgi:deazaflavin-dependent oxidoreductase (nitroreductase family)